MPSIYSHYRFGQDVFVCLSPKQRKTVRDHFDMYCIGLYGPDLLFYYSPLRPNYVNRQGYAMHKETAAVFFRRAGRVIRRHDYDEAYLAYIYGFICHFALDNECHGYILKQIKKNRLRHAQIEAEFDRMLMVKDGLSPYGSSIAAGVRPSRTSAQIISAFFCGVTPKQIYKAEKTLVLSGFMLSVPFILKEGFDGIIRPGIRIGGTRCNVSNKAMMKKYSRAKKKAARLIADYEKNIRGFLPWSRFYKHSFNPV